MLWLFIDANTVRLLQTHDLTEAATVLFKLRNANTCALPELNTAIKIALLSDNVSLGLNL